MSIKKELKKEKFVPQSIIDDVESIERASEKERAAFGKKTPSVNVPGTYKVDNLDMDAIRRSKVRELRDMGYNKTDILKILKNGVVINGARNKFDGLTSKVIEDDIVYIRTEDISEDLDFIEKKADVLSKYNFVYRKAISLALDKDQQAKASLLSVAKTILDKLAEIEGILDPSKLDLRTINMQRPEKLANELNQKLTEKDKDAINATINEILAERDGGGAERPPVSDESSTVRTPSSDNA